MPTQLSLIESDWLDAAQSQVCESIPAGDIFTSDRLHECGISEPINVNLWGILICKLKAAGVIENTGDYTRSKRAEANGRPVAIWRML